MRSVPAKPAGLPVYWPAAGSGALRGSPSVAAAVTVLHELPAPIARLVSVVSASSPQNVTLGLSDGITIVWGDTTRAAEKATELTALMRTHAHYLRRQRARNRGDPVILQATRRGRWAWLVDPGDLPPYCP